MNSIGVIKLELTDHEHQMLNSLKKKQKQWQKFKWFALMAGLINLITGLYAFKTWTAFSSDPDLSTTQFPAVLLIGAVTFLFIGTFCTAKFVCHYKGNPVNTLLIKVIEQKLDF